MSYSPVGNKGNGFCPFFKLECNGNTSFVRPFFPNINEVPLGIPVDSLKRERGGIGWIYHSDTMSRYQSLSRAEAALPDGPVIENMARSMVSVMTALCPLAIRDLPFRKYI